MPYCRTPEDTGCFLVERGVIDQRFGVPADIGLAQVILESGLNGTRRSEANAVGFCQWLQEELEAAERLLTDTHRGEETRRRRPPTAPQTCPCSRPRTPVHPRASEHNAGGTNVGRTLINGEHLGAEDVRARYFWAPSWPATWARRRATQTSTCIELMARARISTPKWSSATPSSVRGLIATIPHMHI